MVEAAQRLLAVLRAFECHRSSARFKQLLIVGLQRLEHLGLE